MGWILLIIGMYVLSRLLGRLSGVDHRRTISQPRMPRVETGPLPDHLGKGGQLFSPDQQQRVEDRKPMTTEPTVMPSALPKVRRVHRNRPNKRYLSHLAQQNWSHGIVMKEILGPPRALRPYGRRLPWYR